MDCQISPRDWDDLLGQPPEVKLTLLWAKTNAETAASLLGAFLFRPKKFASDTGLEPQWFEDTCTALPEALTVAEGWVWVAKHIEQHYGRGDRLRLNNTVKGKTFASRFDLLPAALQERLLDTYHELQPLLSPSKPFQGLTKPLPSPSKGLPSPSKGLPSPSKPLPELELQPVAPNSPAPQEPESALPDPSPWKPLEGLPRGITSHHTTSPSGESEGGAGAVLPEEPEVLQFARSWAGDLAMAIPAGIPAGYAMSWLNWRTGETAPPFPRDWRADLTKRFRADWVKQKPDTRHPAPPRDRDGVKTAAGRGHAEIVTLLAKENDPTRRQTLLAELKTATA